jgi:hydroxypyruvate reductase
VNNALIAIYNAALTAADPYLAVLNAVKLEDGLLQVSDKTYNLEEYERTIVVGAGKASARLAQAIEKLLGDRISAGLIIVKYGHPMPLDFIEQVEAAHPVPDAVGNAATQCILDMLRIADDKTLVICLLSGGASALLVAPADGVTLQDKQQVTSLLLNSGSTIAELNAVRKHLSAVKGGRLAQAAYPAQVLTLILSDVIGDRLDVIASGPTVADGSSFSNAWAVIEKYGLAEIIPVAVRQFLQAGSAGGKQESVKIGDVCLRKTHNVIVGSIGVALAAAAEQARQLGFATEIVSDELQGEASEAARLLALRTRSELAAMKVGEQRCLLWGGETTVTVHGSGKGGRNQELALAFALEIEGMNGVSLLSAGTDGSDGPTDAAGAMVDGRMASQAQELGLAPIDYLSNNDSYTFFQRLDVVSRDLHHFVTGPTGTNVIDVQVLLLQKSDASNN